MSRLFFRRRTSMMGVLAGMLIVAGGFLSLGVQVNLTSPEFSREQGSFWRWFWELFTMLINGQVAFNVLNTIITLLVVLFILAVLVPLGTTLAALFGRRKRSLLILSLVLASLGCLEFLLFEWLILTFSFSPPSEIEGIAGPGFWLILCGFLLCIGSGIVEIVHFRHGVPHCPQIAQ
ncbi:MAG: hypothetical protein J2P36_17420 [Ktedonobacteraceae bacterium]|nr:hypothetical protein [Ktedonobacteraceae bacterium]